METRRAPQERSVTVDGLKLRYLEMGEGDPVLLLHGGSLGSSADVFVRNMRPLADAGFRAIAYDQPGFGLSDTPSDHSNGYRRKSILAFMDALELKSAALVAHSQAGGPAVQTALAHPERVSRIVILGTGSLLPPADEGRGKGEAAVQQRLERRMAASEPTLEDTRKLLEANLFHHELITSDELTLRHSRSVGAAFEAFCARNALVDEAPAGDAPTKAPATPLWRRLVDVKAPMLMIYGREDRAKAFERATELKASYPQLDIHIAEGCKHLVPWDAAAMVAQLAIPFLKAGAR